MKKIGAHVSVSGGVEMAPVNALGIGAGRIRSFYKESEAMGCKTFVCRECYSV